MIDGNKAAWTASSPPMGSPKGLGPNAPTAQRLRLLVEALGYPTSAAFALKLGISAQRWNNFENGMPLNRDVALDLVRAVPGLTLDWLYLGNAAGLSMQMARLLGELPAAPTKPKPPPTRRP